jgi:hypothetical protein
VARGRELRSRRDGGAVAKPRKLGGYVNYWSANSAGETYADFNKHLAYR